MLNYSNSNPRRGFTLIELLVVLAIIAVLIGLLLPAVQQVREAANRVTCSNHLKQLGVAAHNYHDTQRHLPPGVGYYPFATNNTFGTYFFHLLPYVEQGPLFRSSLGTAPFLSPVGPATLYYPGNNNVYSRPVPTFLCPSDPGVDSGGIVMIDGYPFGAASYAPNGYISGTPPPTPGPQGKTRLLAIKDGTSNTILHAEKYARCSNSYMPPAFRDGGTILHAEKYARCSNSYTAWAYTTGIVYPWQPPPMALPGKAFQPGFAIAVLAGHGAPNAIGPGSLFQVQPPEGNCDPTQTATAHSGGMQVGLADGSVRTLARSMSGTTWWAAVTPAGGEVLGSDWD